jgi:hypothetical protein
MPQSERQPAPAAAHTERKLTNGKLRGEKLTQFETAVCDTPVCPERVIQLADQFYEAVTTSGRFSWMGLFEYTDDFERPRLAVYLVEDATALAERSPQQPRPGPVGQTFDPLAHALRPQRYLDLYVLKGTRYSAEEAKELLQQRCTEQPQKAALVWDESIAPVATPVR